jgi:hypothetical protein
MPSPVSSTANIQVALDQALESASATTPVSAFHYRIIKEWPISAHMRSLYILGSPKGAASNSGAPGGACRKHSAQAPGIWRERAVRLTLYLGYRHE